MSGGIAGSDRVRQYTNTNYNGTAAHLNLDQGNAVPVGINPFVFNLVFTFDLDNIGHAIDVLNKQYIKMNGKNHVPRVGISFLFLLLFLTSGIYAYFWLLNLITYTNSIKKNGVDQTAYKRYVLSSLGFGMIAIIVSVLLQNDIFRNPILLGMPIGVFIGFLLCVYAQTSFFIYSKRVFVVLREVHPQVSIINFPSYVIFYFVFFASILNVQSKLNRISFDKNVDRKD